MKVADVGGHELEQRQCCHGRMPVRVDQARHENPAAAINDQGAIGSGLAGDVDRSDAVASDQDLHTAAQRGTGTVKQTDIGKDNRAILAGSNACGLAPALRGSPSVATEAAMQVRKPRLAKSAVTRCCMMPISGR